MTYDRALIITLLITAAFVMLFFSYFAWKRRRLAGKAALYLSICLALVAIYNFGYAMELYSNSLETIMAWVRFQHFGIQGITPMWLLFALSMTGFEKHITPRRIAMLFVIPVIFFLLAQTLGTLNLAHPNPRLDTSGSFPTFTYDRRLWVYLVLVFQSLCLAASTGLFTMMLFRSAPALRKQAALFWIASLVPWVGAILYNFGLSPNNLDLVSIAMAVSSMVFVLGFMRYRLLDIVPLARDIIFDGMADGVLVLDQQNQVLDLNPRFLQMFPLLKKGAVIGQPLQKAFRAYPDLASLIAEDSEKPFDLKVQMPEGNCCYKGTLAPLYNWSKIRIGRIVTCHDYTETKQLLDKLEDLAARDGLTSLFNHRHFFYLAEQELNRFQRYGGFLSLIMLDMDSFKKTNDAYGHMVGDAALKMIAQICLDILRKTDIAGRFGGDEFIILLPETAPDAAALTAERLRAAVANQPLDHENRTFNITASLGVTGITSPSAITLDELFRHVDLAVYQAKNEGRNRVCVVLPDENK
ncbi:MAG: diguanylate cyclase [Anaerolineaceae bacterium]|nr:diguanylate cyclase [Anaerolineaceae bacterium]